MAMLVMLIAGCSNTTITATPEGIPSTKPTKQIKISLFVLQNYTDTPRAGNRAANLVEGILSARGYKVLYHTSKGSPEFEEALRIANEDGNGYFILGGVSEWRYKAGVDGEPAVSLRLALYDSATGKVVWSATGSQSEWGNASLGTVAQKLLDEMIQEDTGKK